MFLGASRAGHLNWFCSIIFLAAVKDIYSNYFILFCHRWWNSHIVLNLKHWIVLVLIFFLIEKIVLVLMSTDLCFIFSYLSLIVFCPQNNQCYWSVLCYLYQIFRTFSLLLGVTSISLITLVTLDGKSMKTTANSICYIVALFQFHLFMYLFAHAEVIDSSLS